MLGGEVDDEDEACVRLCNFPFIKIQHLGLRGSLLLEALETSPGLEALGASCCHREQSGWQTLHVFAWSSHSRLLKASGPACEKKTHTIQEKACRAILKRRTLTPEQEVYPGGSQGSRGSFVPLKTEMSCWLFLSLAA